MDFITRNDIGSGNGNNNGKGSPLFLMGGWYTHPTGYIFGNAYTGHETLNGDITTLGTIKAPNAEIKNIISREIQTGNILSRNGVIDRLQVTNLDVSGAAHFNELVIDKMTSVGGNVVLSPANAKLTRTELIDNFFRRCYFNKIEDGKEIDNDFSVNDFVIAQSFNVHEGENSDVSNKFVWKRICRIGETEQEYWFDVVDDNNTLVNVYNAFNNQGTFETDDEVCVLGNWNTPSRQNAILLAAMQPDFIECGHAETTTVTDSVSKTYITYADTRAIPLADMRYNTNGYVKIDYHTINNDNTVRLVFKSYTVRIMIGNNHIYTCWNAGEDDETWYVYSINGFNADRILEVHSSFIVYNNTLRFGEITETHPYDGMTFDDSDSDNEEPTPVTPVVNDDSDSESSDSDSDSDDQDYILLGTKAIEIYEMTVWSGDDNEPLTAFTDKSSYNVSTTTVLTVTTEKTITNQIYAPAIISFAGINRFSVADRHVSVLSPTFNMISASSVTGIDDLISDEIEASPDILSPQQIQDLIDAGVAAGSLSPTDVEAIIETYNFLAESDFDEELAASTLFQSTADSILLKADSVTVNNLANRVTTDEGLISANSAAIQVNATAISSKVSQTDFNLLGNRVTNAESSITQLSTAIDLKVDIDDAEAAGIHIDGANSTITLSADSTIIDGDLALTGSFESYSEDYMCRTVIDTNSSNTVGFVMSGPDSIDTQTGLPTQGATETPLIRLNFQSSAGTQSGEMTLFDRGNSNSYLMLDSQDIIMNGTSTQVAMDLGGMTFTSQGDTYDRTWEELFCNKLRTKYINTGSGYTVVDADQITDVFIVDVAQDISLYLPYPGINWEGKRFYIKKINSSGNLRLVTYDRNNNEANYLLDGNDATPEAYHWLDKYSIMVLCASNYWIVFRADD